jgi:hemolysin type calcium-binding protein
MSKQIIAAVTTLALGILGLAPAAQAASHVSVSVDQFGVQVNGDASNNSIRLADLVDPQCPGGSPCREVDAGNAVIVASVPCVIPTSQPGGHTALCPITEERGIGVVGGGGNDEIVVSDSVGADAKIGLSGGRGNDTLEGSLAEEVISGDNGNDTIRAGRGDDIAYGDAGLDRIFGSNGQDLIKGGGGFDKLIGGPGGDHLFGQGGNDGMDGSQGRDVCTGGGGRDTARHCERLRSTP